MDIIESDFRLPPEATGKQVRDAFALYPDLLCVALVRGRTPVGLITRSDFLLRYAEEFGPALYDRRSAMLLADTNPLVLEADHAAAGLLGAWETSSTGQLLKGFIVTREGCYAGVSSLLTLLKATRARAETLEALYGDLQAAHQRALEADAAKTRFLATMSHELRTPLNAILGYAELIAEETEAAHTIADAQRIGVAGKHLLGLINEVLDFSSLRAKGLDLEPDWFNLGDWAQEIIAIVRPLADANANRLQLHVSGPTTRIYADAARLRQCAINLIGNACKFTQGGLVAVSIRTSEDQLSIKVSDTGIGMSADQMARLFQPFSQADDSIVRRFGGTGLGLCISQELAHLMGGRIIVSSELGSGSTFEILTPLKSIGATAGEIEAA